MLVYAKLAIHSNIEYRFNFLVDSWVNPLVSTTVEMAMWWTMFQAMGVKILGGFSREYYLSYVTWAVFFSRISANWMYEFRMTQEVESGSLNSILVRPMNFYEFYLGQFIGYKGISVLASFWLPMGLALIIGGTTDLARLPFAILLLFFYLVFTYTLSYCVVSLAFRLTKIGAFTVTKNFFVWLASGELFPLDLLPVSIQKWVHWFPFASGCYVPVGFLTHRLGWEALAQGFIVCIIWTIIFGIIGMLSWKQGLKTYSGTGA